MKKKGQRSKKKQRDQDQKGEKKNVLKQKEDTQKRRWRKTDKET